MGIDTTKQTHNEEGVGNSKQNKWHEFLPICGGEDPKETVLFKERNSYKKRESTEPSGQKLGDSLISVLLNQDLILQNNFPHGEREREEERERGREGERERER